MPVPDLSTLRLTFNEEFNSFLNSPDGSTGTWMTTYPYSGWAARTLSGNSEAQFYSDASVGADPFSLSGGVLQITARPAAPGSNAGNLPYTSGLITTDRSFSQTYGYFEVRAKLPAGPGLWPAFWLLPASNRYSAELDVFEVLGHQPGLVYSSVHGSYGGTWATDIRGNATADTSDGFHVFGVDWEPDTTTFTMDGRVLNVAATPDSMNTPMFMLLNLAVGGTGSWPGAPGAATVFPANMQIDYVRAYATANTRDASGAALVAGPGGGGPGAPVTLGAGPDVLAFAVSGDAWQGNARFTLTVDGTQVGGTQEVAASHGAGAVQVFRVLGSFAPGRHGVMVEFVNDAYGSAGGADRNLYVAGATLNGAPLADAAMVLFANGTRSFSFAGAGGAAVPARLPAGPVSLGAGPDALVLRLAEDAWLGDATFSVSVDGRMIGGVQTVTAAHAAAQAQVFNVLGDFGGGAHVLRVSLLNDAYGGTADTDRNLYVESVALNGTTLSSESVAVLSDSREMSFSLLTFVPPGLAVGSFQPGAPAAARSGLARGDFNGDGRSDVLWQNDDGRGANWLVSAGGGGLQDGRILGDNPGPAWHARATGDFNGDGRADVLWQNDDGQVAVWLVDARGTGVLAGHLLGDNPGPGWHVQGAGNFNGDGRSDILLQHDDGRVAVWLVGPGGGGLQDGRILGGNPGPAWHARATGDFNGDGRADILLQHDDGRVADWLVDAFGTGLLDGRILGDNPGPAWHVRGSGDFNGDGRADILLQHDDGRVADWLIGAGGIGLLDGRILGDNPGPAWQVKGAGDLNGDGRADVLLQNGDGRAAGWLIDAGGTNLQAGHILGNNPGSGWHIVG